MTMDSGELKMGWARQYMPVLAEIRKRFEKEQPLAGGATVGMALHVEAKTAVLVETMAAGGGAEVHITGCNPPLNTGRCGPCSWTGARCALLCYPCLQCGRVLCRNGPGP